MKLASLLSFIVLSSAAGLNEYLRHRLQNTPRALCKISSLWEATRTRVDTAQPECPNCIGYVNLTFVHPCQKNYEACYSQYDVAHFEKDGLEEDWRSWEYQCCTEWGFYSTGSGVPADQLPLISRLSDTEYYTLACNAAFNLTTSPDLECINKHGGYGISYPRLAIIDGEQDPWRPATPHASPFVAGVRNRTHTTGEPFLLIQGGIHVWDEPEVSLEDMAPDLPPRPIREAHNTML
ncbi:MAG: hypothetical protein M1818_005142 [Claussenomyces sp. TS43310]|nr:MAG: hypothetical protein M1818_005142 [Claussenomyces sp. TS43310]